MFTGLITDLGRVRSIEYRGGRRMVLETGYRASDIATGASIACSGACLTVVDRGQDPSGGRSWFAVDVSLETLSKTTLDRWRAGTLVNLERPLTLGEELGGHLVSGHVDGVAEVVVRRSEGSSQRFTFKTTAALAPYVVPKGSITLDGVSLTVNEVEDTPDGNCLFGVNIIPHTAEMTTFGGLAVGDRVNLEIDMLARYLQRLLERQS
jgi:riboflavin synthase